MLKRAKVVLPNIVNVIAVLLTAQPLLELRKNIFEYPSAVEQDDPLHWALRHDDLGEFIANALSGDLFKSTVKFHYRIKRFLFDRKTELRTEAHRAHDTECVFMKTIFGLPYCADQMACDIFLSFIEINDLLF